MPYQLITRAQLRTDLQEKYESVPYWTTAEANAAINEALRMWNFLVGRWQNRVVLTTAPGDYDYALPQTLLYRARVLFNGQPLTPSTYTDLSAGRPGWRTETTASGGDVPTRPTVWIPVSLRWIQIWPADATGHNGLTIDGVATTPILTADGDFVNLPTADLGPVLDYCLHTLSFKKGGAYFAATMPKLQAFLQAAAVENQLLTTSKTYRRWAGLDRRDLKPIQDPGMPTGATTLQAGGGDQ